MNIKFIQLSPMTKVMIAMFGSILAMGEYLGKNYSYISKIQIKYIDLDLNKRLCVIL